MNPKTLFYVVNIAIYPLIIYVIVPFIVWLIGHGSSSSSGDVMGNAIGYAYLVFIWNILFFIVAFIAGMATAKSRFHSFKPALISLAAGLVLSVILIPVERFIFFHIILIFHR